MAATVSLETAGIASRSTRCLDQAKVMKPSIAMIRVIAAQNRCT